MLSYDEILMERYRPNVKMLLVMGILACFKGIYFSVVEQGTNFSFRFCKAYNSVSLTGRFALS